MWTVVLPPENHPFLDDHLLGALTLVVLALYNAGDTWGLGRLVVEDRAGPAVPRPAVAIRSIVSANSSVAGRRPFPHSRVAAATVRLPGAKTMNASTTSLPIVVGIDGSAPSDLALDWAATQAASEGRRLVLLAAVYLPDP